MTQNDKYLPANVAQDAALVDFGDGCRTDRLEALRLECGNGRIQPSVTNIATILDGLADWAGVFAYNELADQIIVARPLPSTRGNPNLHRPRPLQDSDITKTRMWLERRMKWPKVSKSETFDAIYAAARENVISPVRHYLEALPPIAAEDARSYLVEVLKTHFGLREFNSHPDALRFSQIAFRKWLISAVARSFEAGCKADHVLILEGEQGAGKSTAMRILCGDDTFGDSVPPLNTKDAMDYVRGKWIIELAELSSVSKAEVEHVKAYITRTEEKFRPAYARTEVTYQRRCVFVGTTNRTDYLRDETGNRRFWPIKVEAINHDLIRRDRDLIWAAAVALYRAGEAWWLTPDEAVLADAEQTKRTTVDPFYEEIAQWLDDTGKTKTCIAEVARRFTPVEDVTVTATLSPQQQHRIRGALIAAGYDSKGRRFTSGDYKGMTIFERR
jgi:predicted P-loop ATPase